MSRKFLTNIDTGKLQIISPVMESLASAPGSPVKFQLYGNTSDNTLYWWDGAQWIAAKAAAGATPAGTVTGSAVGDASVVGVSTNFAREDHKHGREAFANPTATTTFGLAAVNGVATTLARSDHTHGTPTHDNAAHAAISHSALAAPTADIPWGGFKLTNVGTPSAGTDATTKDYVDNLSAGLAWKDAVRLATAADYGSLTGLAAVDGVTPVIGDRILVKNQAAGAQNGIWIAASGAWTRALDSNTGPELEGATVFVMEGSTNADKAWTMTTNAPITVDTTALAWVQFGAGTAYTAGNGMTLTGSTFDVVGDASITVTADLISRAALTGDVTATAGANGTTIANNVVTNVKAADMAAHTFKGNNTAALADPIDLTIAQMQAELGVAPATLDALYTKRIAQDCAAALTTTVTHNFNSRDVVVEVYRNSTPWDTVEVDMERDTVNSVLVRFAAAPAAGAFRIVVAGIDA
jgi:hypothetical protein